MNYFNKYVPKLDLHGYDREYANYKINEFINDNYKIGNERIIIIHGVGTGILRKETHKILKNNKKVKEFKLNNFNSGETIVIINR